MTYHQDLLTGLWLPNEFPATGYAQTSSGLWVPEKYAKKLPPWMALPLTSQSPPESGTTGQFPPDLLEKHALAPLNVDQALIGWINKAQKAMMDSMEEKMASDIKPWYGLFSTPLVTVDFNSTGETPPKPWASLAKYNSQGVLPPLSPLLDVERESDERVELEEDLTLAGITQNRERLAELLWLGTEVCCLNLSRANQKWREARKSPIDASQPHVVS